MRFGIVLLLALAWCACVPPLSYKVDYRAPDGAVCDHDNVNSQPKLPRVQALLLAGARDLACPQEQLATRPQGEGKEEPLLSVVEGCGKRATYLRDCGPAGRTTRSGVVCEFKLIARVDLERSASGRRVREAATCTCAIKQATVLATVLPSPRHEAAVFSDGKVVYAAGGLNRRDGFLTEILRFDPGSGQVTVMNEHLPSPTQAAGVAWTGRAAYLFGGRGPGGFLVQIVRYEPGTGSVKLMKAQLPAGTYSMGVAWTGSIFYLLGGFDGDDANRILSYDPRTDILTAFRQTLPVAAQAPAVLWDGKGVWILGGASHGPSDAIQYFDPVSGKAARVGQLPYRVWVPASFYDGSCLYLAGGVGTWSGYDSIIGFDPRTGRAATISARLPNVISGRIATWVASVGAAFMLGGEEPAAGGHTDEIIRLGP